MKTPLFNTLIKPEEYTRHNNMADGEKVSLFGGCVEWGNISLQNVNFFFEISLAKDKISA